MAFTSDRLSSSIYRVLGLDMVVDNCRQLIIKCEELGYWNCSDGMCGEKKKRIPNVSSLLPAAQSML